ncbi:alpha/beta hydrolase [Candidatus Dojkabacteria bacterium]|nr:alpha/beta hydrolase [Candidatus Dojkabacteria bacterium]
MNQKEAKKGYRRRMQIGKVSIFYRELGNGGVPVFLFPGFPFSSTIFQPMMQELSPRYKTIALDFPYWSGRTVVGRFRPKVSKYAKLVAKFVKSFNYEKYYVIGYSMGGFISQYALTKGYINPEKFVLMSTFMDGSALAFSRIQKEIIKFVSRKGISSYFKGYASFFLMMYFTVSSVSEFKYFEESFRLKDLMTDFLKMDIVKTVKLLENIQKIKINMNKFPKIEYLSVYAEKDHEYVIEQMKYMARKLNIDSVLVPGSGHAHAFFNYKIASRYIKLFFDR